LLLQNDAAGAKTDFLQMLYEDWRTPKYLTDVNDADEVIRVPEERLLAFWSELDGFNIPSGSNEVWNLLTYFKPTNFTNNTDPAVTSRRTDYRVPDLLSFTFGSGWLDPSENTSPGDNFNESQEAYAVDYTPGTGLTFAIDGTVANPRYGPFFKIRQWLSIQDPPSVTLDGVPLINDLDYRADVKPVSRGHFSASIQWHSTFEDSLAITAPDIGPAGTVNGSPGFVTGRYGGAIRLAAAGQNVTFPSVGIFNLAEGAVEFWYQPTYAHNDGIRHVLWHNEGTPIRYFMLEKTAADQLQFRIRNAGSTTSVTVASGNYSWRAMDWIHIRATWYEAGVPGEQLRIYILGSEPPHSDSGTYSTAGMSVGTNYVGSDSGGNNSASGTIDEFHLYGSSFHPWPLAAGGLKTDPNEYLNDSSRNFTLSFDVVSGNRQGTYLYLGGDSKFRGLNVALNLAGIGNSPDLRWEYWNGAAWLSLEGGGFTDGTNNLTRNGTIYWTSDPANWSLYSVNGGPDLFYVRTSLGAGDYAGGPPVEGVIKTDILLFQYCGDITTAGATFAFSSPVPTAVELLSFEARAGDRAVELTWETAAEVENLGFYLYRGSSEKGPFDRITPSLIPGLGSSPLGARYRYRDSGLTNGETYFYLLEDVEASGKRKKHGPVSATPQQGETLPAPPSAPSAGSSAGIVYGKPEETSFRVLASDRGGMTLELLTGGFYAEPHEDGSVRLSVPGFVEEHEAGFPAIPVKRVWLEAVVGRKVRLVSVRAEVVAAFSALRPTAAEIPEVIATSRVVRAGSRRFGEGLSNGSYPGQWSRVVSVGFQNEVKKALLELAPLRWDGTELLLARRITVRVAFAGREVGEQSLGGSRGRRHREISSHRDGRVAARLSVKQRGLYAVRFEEVMGARGRAIPAKSLRLSHQGKAVAYYLEGGRFGPGSVLYFLSDGASLNPYGDAAIYELSVGEEGVRMPLTEDRPQEYPVRWYWKRAEKEENRIYQPALLEAREPWFWDTLLSPVVKSYPFEVGGLARSAETARLELWLQGASDFAGSPDHHVRVYVNQSLVAEDSWDGKKPRELEAELGPGVLRDGENQISIENVGDTEVSSMVMLERFAVVYPRIGLAEGGSLEGRWGETGAAEAQGFAGSALVLDVTEQVPRWLTGVEPVEGGVRFTAEAGRSYLAVGSDAVLRAEVTRPAPSSLKSERNVAEYLVVGPAELLVEAAPLLELRRSQGLRTKAVPIEEVYSEFGYGEPRPEALREFFAYAYHHWAKPSPRYVLLLGDATYDFKDYLRTGMKNGVPPFLVKTSFWLTASDPSYVSINGEDELPDLAIGRLPAKTADEARILVGKIVAYETAPANPEGRAVLVVDNPDRGGDFEADARDIAASLPPGLNVQTIRVSDLGRDGTRAAIVEAFDRGASMLSYLGHGAILVWASENVFNNMDVRSLSAQGEQPLVLTMNCLNGYFHFPYLNSLSEELVKAEGRGAIAAFSPSGLSLNGPAHRYHRALLSELRWGRRERLGDVVLAAQAAYAEEGAFLELLRIYHLLGDPALRLR